MRRGFPCGIDSVVTVKALLRTDLFGRMRKSRTNKRYCCMASTTIKCGRNVSKIFALCQGTVMTSRTWNISIVRAVIHDRTFNEGDYYVMTGIALCSGRNMIWRLATRNYTIMAAVALLRCSLEYAAYMAGFAGNKFMLPKQRIARGEVIECETLIRDRRSLRTSSDEQRGGKNQTRMAQNRKRFYQS